jgi:membrane dipeptidase
MLIVDAHEDIAYNMLTFGRDYTLAAETIREREKGAQTPLLTDDATLGWPNYQHGRVGIVFAVLFAAPLRAKAGEWDRQSYRDGAEASSIYRHQLDLYERLGDEHPEKFRLVRTRRDLREVLEHWEDSSKDFQFPAAGPGDDRAANPAGGHPVGLTLLMEGAEGLQSQRELAEWWERGLRIIGPAWMGTRFCGGTREPGPLTAEGFALLEEMAQVGFMLDLTHMDEAAVLQALEIYPRQIIASHSNALSLIKGSDSNRHLSDRAIRGILERDGVIGIVPFNAFLKHGWRRGDRREEVAIDQVIVQIDTICQMAGDAHHVGIGTDFDGGFGRQSLPVGLDSIADLPSLAPLLQQKGYSDTDIAAILGENWLTRLRRILPE